MNSMKNRNDYEYREARTLLQDIRVISIFPIFPSCVRFKDENKVIYSRFSRFFLKKTFIHMFDFESNINLLLT